MYCLAVEVRKNALLRDKFLWCPSFSNSLPGLGKISVIVSSHPLPIFTSTLHWIFNTVVWYILLSIHSCLERIPLDTLSLVTALAFSGSLCRSLDTLCLVTALAFSGSLCRSLDTLCLVTALAFSGSLCRSLDTLCRVVVLAFSGSLCRNVHIPTSAFFLLFVRLAADAWKHAAWNQLYFCLDTVAGVWKHNS